MKIFLLVQMTAVETYFDSIDDGAASRFAFYVLRRLIVIIIVVVYRTLFGCCFLIHLLGGFVYSAD